MLGGHVIRSGHQFHAQPVTARRASGRGGSTRKALAFVAAGAAVAIAATACGSAGGTGASPGGGSAASPGRTSAAAPSQPAAMSLLGAHSLPAQASQTLPAFPAYYDAHKDVVVVTDAFPQAAAAIFHANFAPALSAVRAATQPLWYIVRGRAAPGQLAVLGSQPGEKNYSPLWRTVLVRWQPGATPQLLTSDNMINGLAAKGKLTATPTSMVVNAAVVSMP
jgi:hypothetical protein